MGRRAYEAVARNQRWVGGMGGLENPGVVERVIARNAEPAQRPGLDGEICSACSRQIRVKARYESAAAGAWWRRDDSEADDVVEAVLKIFSRNLNMVGGKLLVHACVPSAAALGPQRRIARVAGICSESLIESRLLDSLAVKCPNAGIAPEALAVTHGKRRAKPRNDARSEVVISLGTRTKIEDHSLQRQPTKIQIAPVIVATHVPATKNRRENVPNSIFIP